MTKEEWKNECQKFVDNHEELSGLGSIWDEDDPYELEDAAQAAFSEGQTPEDFINEMFEEDLANAEYNDHLAEESEQQEEELDDGLT